MPKARLASEALIAALSKGKVGEAATLVSQGCDVNARVDGRTPLQIMVESGRTSGFEWLLANGASPNIPDDNDVTPLMAACIRAGKKKCRQMALDLINAKCDVTFRREEDGMSALEFAAKYADPEIVRTLVEHGAAVNGKKGQDLFPALLAVRGGNLPNLIALVDLGCDLSRKTRLPWAKGMTCLGVARLEKKKEIVKYLEELAAK